MDNICAECCGVCAGAAWHQNARVVVPRPESFAAMTDAQKDAWFRGCYAKCKQLRESGAEPEVAYYYQYQWARSEEGKAWHKEYARYYKKTDHGKAARKRYNQSPKGKIAKAAEYQRRKERLRAAKCAK